MSDVQNRVLRAQTLMSFQKVPCVAEKRNKRMEDTENAQLGETAQSRMSQCHGIPAERRLEHPHLVNVKAEQVCKVSPP